jgi:glycosylphosphatidylinositol phospholipase D
LLQNNKDSLLPGATFPDWFYACGQDLHSASEDAHWPPFYQQAVEYIREKKQEKGQNQDKLVAFLAGIMSHGIADINWHGLSQRDQLGFLRTMGKY